MRFTRMHGGSAPRGARRARAGLAALALAAGAGIAGAAAALPGGGGPVSSLGGSGWSWYKTDTHVHSVISGDAVPDLGIIAESARADGYNAIFLTDHNLGSTFPISIQKAADVVLDDSMPRWFPLTSGAPSAVTSKLVSSPVKSGAMSLHLAASAPGGVGESAVWTKRGANFRSGDDILTFAVNPKTLTGASGLYVSAAVGGDPTVGPPAGYTTTGGVVTPGLSKIFVYYLGAPPPASLYPGSQLFAFNLGAASPIPGLFSCDQAGVVQNAWTSCTINLNKALPLIAAAEQPLDYNGFSDIKIAAVASGGTADAFFDSYRLKATAPVAPAEEFAFRNGIISQYDTPSFRIYPSVEMGVGKHTNRFDFGFLDPAGFTSFFNGVDGVPGTHAAGEPAQLDHPGVNGGVTDQEAFANDAYGADVMEVRFQNMIDDWDRLLTKGVVLIGTWATDNHNGNWSAGSQTTWIQAPSIGFDDLIRSLYEGRGYLATSAFGGRAIFNPDPASPDAHPARYPIFVSAAQTSASAHLAITGGITPGSTVAWITNGGAVLAEEATTGASYDAVRQIPIAATPFAYTRAELRDASGIQRAMTEPIIWKRVAGLPAGMSVRVEGVATASGRGYTNEATRGATGVSYDAGLEALTLALENPAGSLVDLESATAGAAPSSVTVDGAAVPRAASRADHDAAAGPSWFYDGASGLLRARVRQGAGATSAVVSFAAPAGDTVAPSAPTGLVARATGPTRIDLGWGPASDAVGVAGYDVYRDGAPIARLGADATTYADTTVAPGTSYQFQVDAFDAAGNVSAAATATAATPGTEIPPTGPPATTPTTPTTPTPPTTQPKPPKGTTPATPTRTPTGPAASETGTPAAPGEPGAAPSPAGVVTLLEGAFQQIASQPHGEGFRTSVSLLPAKRPAEAGGAALRPLRQTVKGQTIVQDGGHARASLQISGVPGRLSVVAFGGRLFASRAGGRYRLATGALRAMLPPVVPSGLGGVPTGVVRGLVGPRDLGTVTIGTATARRYRAALAPPELRRYLTGALVRAGLSPARARTVVATSRITLNRVDLDVAAGQLEREWVTVRAIVPAGRARAGAILSAQVDVRLSDYGAELSVLRPRASGVAATIGALR